MFGSIIPTLRAGVKGTLPGWRGRRLGELIPGPDSTDFASNKLYFSAEAGTGFMRCWCSCATVSGGPQQKRGLCSGRARDEGYRLRGYDRSAIGLVLPANRRDNRGDAKAHDHSLTPLGNLKARGGALRGVEAKSSSKNGKAEAG